MTLIKRRFTLIRNHYPLKSCFSRSRGGVMLVSLTYDDFALRRCIELHFRNKDMHMYSSKSGFYIGVVLITIKLWVSCFKNGSLNKKHIAYVSSFIFVQIYTKFNLLLYVSSIIGCFIYNFEIVYNGYYNFVFCVFMF